MRKVGAEGAVMDVVGSEVRDGGRRVDDGLPGSNNESEGGSRRSL